MSNEKQNSGCCKNCNGQEEKQIEEMALIIGGSEIYDHEDYLEARQKAKALYNADYRRQEWISVDERLPEESCEVLTVDRTGVMYLAPYSDRYKAFNATDEDDGDRWKLTVTHWMPLPEAPKMKGESDEKDI